MTRRALVFLPFAVLVLIAALLAFRAGYWQANLTETDVINTYASKYLHDTGGRIEDCSATPGTGEVWLTVTCQPVNGAPVIYPVNKRGALLPLGAYQEAT